MRVAVFPDAPPVGPIPLDWAPTGEGLELWLYGRDGTVSETVMWHGTPMPTTASPIAASLTELFSHRHLTPIGVVLDDSPLSREVAALLAGRRAGALLCGCQHIRREDCKWVVQLVAYGGRLSATVEADGMPLVATMSIEAKAGGPETAPAPSTVVEWVPIDERPYQVLTVSPRPPAVLPEARWILAGGRGLGSAASFDRLRDLANRIGAVPGASLAAVEAGWATSESQVGQTGNTVAPEVYVALGISGATQHVAGMVRAKRVVAVNNDPSAPIFRVADLGVVADANRFIEGWLQALNEARPNDSRLA